MCALAVTPPSTSPLDVFLVPVGANAYQLYCEIPAEPATAGDALRPEGGWLARWWKRRLDGFKRTLAEAEEERARHEAGHRSESGGLWRKVLRKIAEVIAEQRLLWHLRGVTAARLVHPSDVSAGDALDIARSEFRRDYERHRRWCIIDTLLFLPCTLLTIIPGPNVPALYFSFRAVGHFLSMRGAKQGLDVVAWERRPAPPLTDLRHALALDPHARNVKLDEIAATLGLERLSAFVQRVSRPAV